MMVDNEKLLERRYRVLGRNSPLFYERPVQLVKGEGVWVEDAEGRRYLDVYNNVPHVGHCHPHVVAAICKQAALVNLHTRYLHENVVRYAERLTATFEPSLSAVMFTCTGTEANELALRMARYKSGGQGIIVSDFSYHGNSQTLASVTSCFPTPEPFPDFARSVPVPDPYRDRNGLSDEALGDLYAGYVDKAIKSLQAKGIQLAAMLIDASFANEGLPEPVPGYVAKALKLVQAAGGCLIADEVQCGFGRTGEAMWGYQLAGIVPDFVTMGKPMGNGHPVGGVVANRDLVDSFGLAATYFNTFGGNPVSAAAGMAVLDVIEKENLLENAKNVGAYVRAGLHQMMTKHDIIGNVRGRGLFFGLELVTDKAAKTPAGAEAKQLINLMRDRGVLVSRIGRYDNILKMRPSMVFAREHADLLLATLDDALAAL